MADPIDNENNDQENINQEDVNQEDIEQKVDELNNNSDVVSDEDQSAEKEILKKFENIELLDKKCFGYNPDKTTSWFDIAKKINDVGWNKINKESLEYDLTTNVDDCYKNIATMTIHNIDDQIKYKIAFDNNKMLWKLEIVDSPDAEISPEEIKEFFSSAKILKFITEAVQRIKEANNIFDENIKLHVEEGELLDVDEIKLSAILWFINNNTFIENFVTAKYMLM